MKKNLRLLCLGLAAATFTAGFAQAENVTSKLINADMEKGVIGWNIKFDSHIWKKNTKKQTTHPGYHGVTNAVLENWKGDATTGLSNNTISQSLTNLPNGTYVFGAYIAATQQDSIANRETVEGVTLFANEASVPVATNNPEYKGQKWSHTAKFNVAVNVIDGTLNVGLKAESTNANFLMWDNATLYYFGDMDAAAALDEMAKIDMAATVAIADTCVAYKMNVDTLAYLNEQIEAGKALTSAAEAYDTDENVYWAIRLANKSISDYRSFNNAVAAAKEVVAIEWSDAVATAVEELNALIAEADGIYEAATATRDILTGKKAELNEATAYVELDSSYLKLDETYALLDEIEPGEEVGQYSEEMINEINDLLEQVGFVLAESEEGLSAITAKFRCDSLYDEIQYIFDNPISVDAFPFTVGEADGTVATKVDGRFEFTSKTYAMAYPVTNLRFTFLESYNENGAACLDSGKYPQIAIAEFYIYDGDGNQIELEEANFYTNAQEGSEGPMKNICDGDKATFWHSAWSSSVGTWHYLEITLPEGEELTEFSFGWTSRYTAQVVPKTVEVSSVSSAQSDLESAIASATSMNAYRGTSPGFYNADLTAFYNAIAAAQALKGSDASDEEIYAAIGVLETEQGKLDEMSVVLPEPGKKYRFISAGPFFGKQGAHKAITVHTTDSIYANWLWWETASPDSTQQEFSFEVIPNEEGKLYYAIKHEATGLYIGDCLNAEGEAADNAAGLIAEKDTVELQPLGFGQFGIVHNGMLHAGDHNSGNVSTDAGAYGGIYGVSSSLVKWNADANSASAWYIREVRTLPYAAKSLSDVAFQSETITLYSGVNTLTLTADKDCAFADLVVYDLLGNVVPTSVTANGANATVVLDTTVVEAFSFEFANAEGVATVTVDGVISKLSQLQDAYDNAIAVAPVKGDEIGEFSDLAEYEAAIKAAEELLANGGSDDEIVKAAADLDSAVVHLECNLPLPDKTYFILSGFDAFKEKHGVDMAIYAREDAPAWSYVGVSDPAYLWKFVETEPMNGARVFYLQNVGTEMYMGSVDAFSTALSMAAAPEGTQPFRIDVQEGTVVTICDGRYSNGNLHMNGHGGGSGAFGNLVYWSSTVETASALRVVESEKYIKDLVDNIEDVEFVDEYVAPAKKGIYDLFGRRLEAPAAAGIYIIDGKKRVIKK